MKAQPLRTIGGLVLTMFDDDGGNGHLTLQVPREALSLLGVQCIQEIGSDASEDLILACRALVNKVDADAAADAELFVPPWRTLKKAMRDDIAEMKMDEIAESAKELAHEALDKMTLREIAEEHLLAEQKDDHDPTDEEIAAWIEANKEVPGEA